MSSVGDDAALAQLRTRGYCVIESFLQPALVAALAADYAARGRTENANYDVGVASGEAVEAVHERVEALTERLRAAGETKAAFAGLHQAYYFAAQAVAFNAWHQDAESHYLLGTHRDYLNFYIPVIKPSLEKTNLQVIPADSLRVKAPELWSRIENAGGTLCHVSDDRAHTTVLDEAGERARLPFDIDSLAVTPKLHAGDLLLMRGDTFHRTQDADTARVALSLRLCDPDLPIRLEDLARGSSKKMNLMAGNWAEFGPVFSYLENLPEGEEASWQAVRDHARACAPAVGAGKPSKWVGRRRILREKIKQGLLLDTARREVGFRTARRRVGAGG